MKTLYEASNAAEAHMLVDLLQQQGIKSQVLGEHLQGAVGGLPAMGLVRVVVDDDQNFLAAREVIAQWEATEVQQPTARQDTKPRYSGLRNFLLGLTVGVLGMLIVFKTPVTVEGIDYDRDGVLDEKWTYSLGGRLLKLEADRNLDLKIDHIVTYGLRGNPESAESDDDFDGKFESRSVFRGGNLLSFSTDTDGDTFPDMRSLYKHGVLESVEFIKSTSGYPIRVEWYKLGKLQYADIDTNDDGKLDTRQSYSPLGEIASRQPIP
jgi:antitoxin component YwqK of YwqJK toxin-antitoxin module